VTSLDSLYDLTAELYGLVQQPLLAEEREDMITKVEYLLQERSQYIDELVQSKESQKDARGKIIVSMNAIIDSTLLKWKKSVEEDLQKTKAKKQHVNRYVNPYGNETFDGSFYDKRN